ncbi:MAG: DUF3616 domain-containing protein [Roseomonas sp.]|nr:DUF3616 domain-containing protein [Roseomonas sp.]
MREEAKLRDSVRIIFVSSALLVTAFIWSGASAQPALQPTSSIIVFRDACEPSAAVFLLAPGDRYLLVVANDGDNTLRAYDASQGGPAQPVAALDDHLAIPSGDRGRRRGRVDIEAAAELGGRIYWIASHSRENDEGELRPNRHKLFATDASLASGSTGAIELRTVGLARSLIEALSHERLGLRDAIGVDQQGNLRRRDGNAKAEGGGLNIEGLARGFEDGTLLIGLRSPLRDGNAILLGFLNPAAVVERSNEGPIIDPNPILLNLGGRGVRSIEYLEGAPADRRYLIVAGRADGGDDFTVFRWSGERGEPALEIAGAASLLRRLTDVSDSRWGERFRFGPEAMAVAPGEQTLYLLSDDGDRMVDGSECQADETPTHRRSFRGVALRIE